MKLNWNKIEMLSGKKYSCGYCGSLVAQDRGFKAKDDSHREHRIYICPQCTQPTFFHTHGRQTPSTRMGREIQGIEDETVSALYNEARDCTSVGAYTATILLCRKILMNVAVQHEAKEGKSFVYYIDFLQENGFIPPNGKSWVDEVRKKGNDATHQTPSPEKGSAEQIMGFVEMLLIFVYEFPSLMNTSDH